MRVGSWRKLSAKESMPLNCGVGKDSWESLELQGDPTSPPYRKSVLDIHWKHWCCSWSSNTLATWCDVNSLKNSLMLGKIEGNRRRGRQRVRWFDSTTDSMDMNLSKLQEIVEDRGAWSAAVHGVTKSQTRLSNWTTTLLAKARGQKFYALPRYDPLHL